jgi:diguanylate cyclase (GGDEF)-like protein/PAS domain S-box-containing protein
MIYNLPPKKIKHQTLNSQEIDVVRTITMENELFSAKAALESISEGILVVGLNHKIILHNKIFFDIWNLSQDIWRDSNQDNPFKHLSEQVLEKEIFCQMIMDAGKSINYRKEWQLKSGKIIEHTIHPCIDNGSLIAYTWCFRDITERKKLSEKLLYQATHDSLTGLINSDLLIDRIYEAIMQSHESRHIGIVFFDLDNFKQVNDNFGHHMGDQVLQSIARRIKECVNENDTITRLGGDEFVIVLPNITNHDQLNYLALMILDKIAQPHYLEDCELMITASLGISLYRKDGYDAETLIKKADLAMYHAKAGGKNSYLFYSDLGNDSIFSTM